MSQFSSVLSRIKSAIQKSPSVAAYATRKVAEQQINRIKNRIRSGRKRNGSKMQTASSNRIGAYSAEYAKKRAAMGLPVSAMDLRVTGQLLDNYQVVTSQTGNTARAQLGFTDNKAAQIAGYQQELQGDIFGTDESVANLVWDEFKLGLQQAIG